VHIPLQEGVVQGARLAFGGMAATPVRATSAEGALDGKAYSLQSVEAAQEALAIELNPISDARASAAYRLQVAQNLLERVRLEASGLEALV